MDTLVNTSGTTDYDYNHRNQLASVTRTDSSVVDYEYDHNGNRISRTIGSSSTKYIWDELSAYGDVILEADETDTTIAEYTLANGQLVSQNRSGTPSYYLYDAQGSVRSLTNSSGTPTDQYDYTAFGELKNYIGSSTPNNYQYTGQQYDGEIDLYSLRARYYDPANGRFLSKDTWPIDLQNPIELNRYGYTANNPVNFGDPSGLSSLPGLSKLSSVLGTIISVAAPKVSYFVGLSAAPFSQGVFLGFAAYTLGIVVANLIKGVSGNSNRLDEGWNFKDAFKAMILGATIGVANFWVGRWIRQLKSRRETLESGRHFPGNTGMRSHKREAMAQFIARLAKVGEFSGRFIVGPLAQILDILLVVLDGDPNVSIEDNLIKAGLAAGVINLGALSIFKEEVSVGLTVFGRTVLVALSQ